MKKLLLILLFTTAWMQGQTLQNPTYNNTTTNTLKIKTPATVSTVNFLSTNEADGSVSKIAPINVNIPFLPVNYSAPTQTIGNHLSGIDTRLGQISSTVYSKIVYVNNVNPNSATIFDIRNPPVANDNSLKTDVNNLYIGSDNSTWVYQTSPAGYVTKSVSSATSNFYLEGTTIDSGISKTANIYRSGRTGFGVTNMTGVLDIFTGTASYSADLNALPNGVISFGNDNPSGNAPTIFAKSTNSIGLSLISGSLDANMTDDMRFSVRRIDNIDFTDLTKSAFRFVRGGNNTLFQILRNGNSILNGTLNVISDSSQLMLKTKTNTNRQLQLGYNLSGNYGYVQSIEETVNYRNLALNPDGGNVLIGKTSDDTTNKLQVNGSIAATNYNGSASLTGTPTAPTAPVGTSTTQIATTAFVQASARPYKVYTAFILQSGTSAPTATVLENNLGGTVVFTRTSTGIYRATLTGVINSSKTVAFFNYSSYQAPGSQYTSALTPTSDYLILASLNNGNLADSILGGSLEIRVYP